MKYKRDITEYILIKLCSIKTIIILHLTVVTLALNPFDSSANIANSESSALTTAQQVRKISGKVTDQSGTPIPGASIVVKGTSVGVSAFDKNFLNNKLYF